MYDDILLEPVQEELLMTLVEAARNVPLEQRSKFSVLRTLGGDFLHHPSLAKRDRRIYLGDVEALAREGLLALRFTSRGDPQFDITPSGFEYYEYLKKRTEDSVGRIETTMKNYLDAHQFQQKYSVAYQKWSSAEDLLWGTDTEQQLTTIGHLCREAVQEFTSVLIDHHKPANVTDDKTKTVARLRAILEAKSDQLGSKEKAFLEALLAYWGTVNDLIQRQKHGAQKEGERLVWEDARRVVFQTAIVMFEIDNALSV